MTPLKTLLALTSVFAYSFVSADPIDEAGKLLHRPDEGDQFKSQVLRNYINQKWFKERFIPSNQQSPIVFLALGNISQTINDKPWSEKRRSETISLVTGLHNKGYRIAYDRNSPELAKIVKDHVPVRYRLGIGGHSQRDKTRAISVTNPWVRLEMLLSFEKIIVSPDSTLGTALILEGMLNKREGFSGKRGFDIYSFDIDADSHLDDLNRWQSNLANGKSTYNPSSAFKLYPSPTTDQLPIVEVSTFSQWTTWLSNIFWLTPQTSVESPLKQEYEPTSIPVSDRKLHSFGVSYYNFPKVLHSETEAFKNIKLSTKSFLPIDPYTADHFLNSLTTSEITFALKYATDFTKYSKELLNATMTDLQNSQKLSTAAVLFGSGTGSSVYEPLVESAVKVLAKRKISITTGGCGGYMAVANQTAYELGVPSIGIPHRNFSEIQALSLKNQTYSLMVPSYDERIPFLLQGKKLVVVAPGGPGTVKEIATTLVLASAESDSDKIPYIIFLDLDYYGGFVQWLKSLRLPDNLMDKIRVVHSEKEMEDLIHTIDV